MRNVAIVVVVVAFTGCVGPTAPSSHRRIVDVPTYHGIPAVAPNGEILHVCATQPRTYLRCDRPGDAFTECRRHTERDHYLQPGPCPATPID